MHFMFCVMHSLRLLVTLSVAAAAGALHLKAPSSPGLSAQLNHSDMARLRIGQVLDAVYEANSVEATVDQHHNACFTARPSARQSVGSCQVR